MGAASRPGWTEAFAQSDETEVMTPASSDTSDPNAADAHKEHTTPVCESPVKAARRIWEAKLAQEQSAAEELTSPKSPAIASGPPAAPPLSPLSPTRLLVNCSHLSWSRRRVLFGVGSGQTPVVTSMSFNSDGSAVAREACVSKGGTAEDRSAVARRKLWEERIAAVQAQTRAPAASSGIVASKPKKWVPTGCMVWDKRRCTFEISDSGAPEDTADASSDDSVVMYTARLSDGPPYNINRFRSISGDGCAEGGVDGNHTVFRTARASRSPWGSLSGELEQPNGKPEDTADASSDDSAVMYTAPLSDGLPYDINRFRSISGDGCAEGGVDGNHTVFRTARASRSPWGSLSGKLEQSKAGAVIQDYAATLQRGVECAGSCGRVVPVGIVILRDREGVVYPPLRLFNPYSPLPSHYGYASLEYHRIQCMIRPDMRSFY